MGIAKKILKWSDKLFERSVETENEVKSASMAITSGIIEGVVDVCVVNTVILVIAGILKKKH